MKGTTFFNEWKSIFANKKLLIPIIAILIVPVMYAGMFLWAFWDPYEKMNELPVAVVNADKGASFDGEDMQLGDELVMSLKENGTFNFKFVDKEDGYDGLHNLDYYLLIEIPEDFSKNATTLLENEPKKLELIYVPNQGYNFLAAQIGETAIEKVKSAVSEEVIETYAETVFDAVQTMADGYKDASGGASELYEGLQKINDGSGALKEHLSLLAEKQVDFQNGISELYDGAGQLSEGSGALADGLGELEEGQGQLSEGAKKVETGLDSAVEGGSQLSAGLATAHESSGQLIDGTEKLKDGADSLEIGADTLNSSLKEFSEKAEVASTGASALNQGIGQLEQSLQSVMPILPSEAKEQLETALSQLKDGSQSLADGNSQLALAAGQLAGGAGEISQGAGQLSTGLGQAVTGQTALHAGLSELAAGSDELNNALIQLQQGQSDIVTGMQTFGEKLGEAKEGSKTLHEGLETISGGITQLSDGSAQLVQGTGELKEGAGTLAEGAETAAGGSKELTDGLSEAAEESSEVKANENTYEMMASPLELDTDEVVADVPNYGTGFAPYFVSLGLFVGALMMSIVYPMTEPASAPRNGFSWFAGKFGVMAIVGVIQALLADFILLNWLGIKVQSIPLFIIFSMLTSLTFIVIIQFLVTVLKDAGRFVAIIILILQLTTSAGTFPLELIPDWLQPFHAFLPMSYTVKGFKAAISSGDFGFMWQNAAILAGYAFVFIAGTILYFVYKYKKQYGRLAKDAMQTNGIK